MSDLCLWPAIALIFFLAGIVKGVTGMGLPTVAMGLLGAVMPPLAAAALLIVPSFVTNIWQLFSGPGFSVLAARLWSMMAGIVVGTAAGSAFLASGNVGWTTAGLGSALVAYAGFTLLGWQVSVPKLLERRLSPLVGLATGVVTGCTGVFVIPAVPYLQALGLNKDDLIQALGLSFTISTIALGIGLAWHGAFQFQDLATSSLTLAPALLGMWVGQAIRHRISPTTFRRWFLVCLLALGAELAVRPFF